MWDEIRLCPLVMTDYLYAKPINEYDLFLTVFLFCTCFLGLGVFGEKEKVFQNGSTKNFFYYLMPVMGKVTIIKLLRYVTSYFFK
jgi:hypothetical protein